MELHLANRRILREPDDSSGKTGNTHYHTMINLEGKKMSKRIVIMGAGAAGSYLGAYMTKEGHDVTLVDMWGEAC